MAILDGMEAYFDEALTQEIPLNVAGTAWLFDLEEIFETVTGNPNVKSFWIVNRNDYPHYDMYLPITRDDTHRAEPNGFGKRCASLRVDGGQYGYNPYVGTKQAGEKYKGELSLDIPRSGMNIAGMVVEITPHNYTHPSTIPQYQEPEEV